MTKPKILEVGPDISKAGGGMASVIREITRTPYLPDFNITAFSSFEDGTKYQRLINCLQAYRKFQTVVDGYDLIHIHMTSGMSAYRKAWYIQAAKDAGKPVLVQLHCTDYFTKQWKERSELYRKRVGAALQRADRVCLLSAGYISEFSMITGVKNCSYLPNFIDPDKYTPADAVRPARFLFLGKAREDKGAGDIIRAAWKLKMRCHLEPDICFAGTGDTDEYKDLAKGFALNNVHFTDRWVSPEETKQLLAEYPMLLLPSYHEGMPMSVLEAMAAGDAVIGTDVGAIPEMITDTVLHPGDINGLCEAMKRYCEDPEKTLREGKENRSRAENRFAEKIVMKRLGGLYARLLERKKNG